LVRWCVATLAFAVLAAPPVRADVYSFIDDDGTPRFSNIPDDPRYRLFIKEPGSTARTCDAQKPGDCKLRVPESREGLRAALENPLLQRRPFHGEVKAAAGRFMLDPALIHAVIEAESRYDPKAVSGKGAIGLMQVMPETGRRYGVRAQELRVPAKNIVTGTQYLADLLRLFEGDVELALAGYNAGEHAVARHGDAIPPYAETKAYVPRVVGFWKALSVPGAEPEVETSGRNARPRQ
jgi:soluble lytic murein transglycosylase-like protein